MPDFQALARDHAFASEYYQHLLDHWSNISRILIVVDGPIFAARGIDFNLGRVIAELRSFKTGLARIEVDVATRNGEPEYQATPDSNGFNYHGFRFNKDSVLNKYDQVWLFGYWPGNSGLGDVRNDANSLDPKLDQIIGHSSFHPVRGSELAVLVRWMNGGGGLFATGDHHLLGASIAAGIPRVNRMRRWRIRQGVPTRDNPTRFDTNQPTTSAQLAGAEEIPTRAEGDARPQPVEWVSEFSDSGWLIPRKMPHPILCHPSLGPIDVLPDHPHEGSCYDVQDAEWLSANADAVYTVGSVHGPHFPKAGSIRPLPKTIAWGRTLAAPPLSFEKGPQPYRRVPLINIYDGQRIEIGRVVVDSTWHHWFDMNLNGLAASEDPRPHEKIMRYYINVAIWLAQPGFRAAMTLGGLKAGQFDYFGLESAELQADPAQLGMSTLRYFAPSIGACWVRNFADEAVARIHRPAGSWPRDNGRPILTSPPEDYVHAVVLGEIVKELYSDLPEALEELAKTGRIKAPRNLRKDPSELAVNAAHRGLAHVTAVWRDDLSKSTEQLEALSSSVKKHKPQKKEA